MGRQVFQHDADQLGLWIVKVDEITHALGEVAGDALVCDLDRAPGPVGIEEDKHVGRAVAAILAVVEAMEPTLLIADEPTTALDATIQSQIIDLLVDLTHRHGTALLLATHNIALVAEIADQIGVMYGGTIVELGPKGRVLDAPRHPYTAALVDSIPRLDEPDRPLLADRTMVHGGQALMAWAVGNARVEPRGNAIIITKQASGSAKIDPLRAALNALALKATTRLLPSGSHGRARQSFSGAGASTGSL